MFTILPPKNPIGTGSDTTSPLANILLKTKAVKAVKPGFNFWLSFFLFFPRSVTNRRLVSTAHAYAMMRTTHGIYRSCRREKLLGSLSKRTFQATPPSFEWLRLGRGLLRMTYLGQSTLCCRRRREWSGFGGVVKVVVDISGS